MGETSSELLDFDSAGGQEPHVRQVPKVQIARYSVSYPVHYLLYRRIETRVSVAALSGSSSRTRRIERMYSKNYHVRKYILDTKGMPLCNSGLSESTEDKHCNAKRKKIRLKIPSIHRHLTDSLRENPTMHNR